MNTRIILLMLCFFLGACSDPNDSAGDNKVSKKEPAKTHVLSDHEKALEKARKMEEEMKKAEEKRRKAIEEQRQ